MRLFVSTLLLSCLFILDSGLSAQSSWSMVENLLISKCASGSSCHSGGATPSGLRFDLGTAGNYGGIYKVDPSNATAKANGYKLVYPGDPYRSFLWLKVNDGLSHESLESGEGSKMPPSSSGITLSDPEKELVRQWILEGAHSARADVDTAIIRRYYENPGNISIASPPAPPAPGKGFQIHFGPLFIEESGEEEVFLKYELDKSADMEVVRLENEMGLFSHHWIILRYTDLGTAASTEEGIRRNQDHDDVDFVAAIQNSKDIKLPDRTAFFWNNNDVLDFNSHYINYDADSVLKAEVYVNVYTDPVGTAQQEMKTELLVNPAIWIPADGMIHTIPHSYFDASWGEIFLWSMTTHTHKYGTDFDVYFRTASNTKGPPIFDASCSGGIPGCPSPLYDYQHPPTRYWEDFLPIDMSLGVIQEASYLNYGTSGVGWGSTSDDEMMITLAMYIEDTTGLTSGENQFPQVEKSLSLFPQPNRGNFVIDLRPFEDEIEIEIFDLTGRLVHTQFVEGGKQEKLFLDEKLKQGVYLLRLAKDQVPIAKARLSIFGG